MTTIFTHIAAVAALAIGILAGVLGVFSLATGNGVMTAVLVVVALLGAYAASRIPFTPIRR
jgi:hypothetical protein